jgi:hypothetical protein
MDKIIYHLSIGREIIYVGQTDDLDTRLKAHLYNHPEICILPSWIKERIKITQIDATVKGATAHKIERYWIDYYTKQGFTLLNKTQAKHSAKLTQITDEQAIYILDNASLFKYIQIPIHPDTLKKDARKNKIKSEYFNTIFATHNTLIINTYRQIYYPICNNDAKIV